MQILALREKVYGHLKKIYSKVWAFNRKSMLHALGLKCCLRSFWGRRQKEKPILTRNSTGLYLRGHINVIGVPLGDGDGLRVPSLKGEERSMCSYF